MSIKKSKITVNCITLNCIEACVKSINANNRTVTKKQWAKIDRIATRLHKVQQEIVRG